MTRSLKAILPSLFGQCFRACAGVVGSLGNLVGWIFEPTHSPNMTSMTLKGQFDRNVMQSAAEGERERPTTFVTLEEPIGSPVYSLPLSRTLSTAHLTESQLHRMITRATVDAFGIL